MQQVQFEIVTASPSDLYRLHRLASAAMTLETFSVDLLGQKLFFNPHPGRDDYRTLIAAGADGPIGLLQSVMRPDKKQAWLGLFAVDQRYRRQGVATRLFEAAREIWREAGIAVVEVMTIPSNYLLPGIDPRYTPAICFVEAMGFQHKQARVNMRAWLDGDFDTTAAESELRHKGVEIRRAHRGDWAMLERFFAAQFGEGWLHEAGLAMAQDPPGMHLAIRDGEILAFSAHSTMNQEWGNFGPMGTAEAARGLGLGQVLLLRCMADLKANGHESSVIPWVGPYGFYARLLHCAIERVFWQYRMELVQPNAETRTV